MCVCVILRTLGTEAREEAQGEYKLILLRPWGSEKLNLHQKWHFRENMVIGLQVWEPREQELY